MVRPLSSGMLILAVRSVQGEALPSDARTLASRFKETRARSSHASDEHSASAHSAWPLLPAPPLPSGPALYIVTPAERGPWRPLWTSGQPSWPVLGRLIGLARAAEASLAAAVAPVVPLVEAPTPQGHL